MLRLTLDWNCVIAVENDEAQSQAVLRLIEGHRNGEFEVALLGASASENTRSKRFPGNASYFKMRVKQLEWEDLPIVPTPLIIDFTYIGFSYPIKDGAAFRQKFDALWNVIAPNIARKPKDYIDPALEWTDESSKSEALKPWRNAWCDVMSAYCHIQQERDVFVTTNTDDFQKQKEELSRMGMKYISDPTGVPELLSRLVD